MKIINLLVVIILIFSLSSFVLAENDTNATPLLLADAAGNVFKDFNEPVAFCESFIQDYNLLEVTLPNYVPYKNEVFNFYTLYDEYSLGYVELVERKVSAADCGAHAEPTFKVFVKSEASVQKILDSPDPFNEFRAQQKSGDLKIVGETFGKKVKSSYVKVLSGIASWFI